MFWMKKTWWRSLLAVTKRERAGLISLFTLLGLLAWITHRYRRYDQQEALDWSVQQWPVAPEPSKIEGSPKREVWRRETSTHTRDYSSPGWGRKSRPADRYRLQPGGEVDLKTRQGGYKPYAGKSNWPEKVRAPVAPQSIDVNEADSLDWLQLPGIGPMYTRRILRFRAKLGGFHDLNQIRETYGLPDTTFERIKPYLELRGRPQPWINLNTADLETLSAHPYISQALARHIIAFRQQHGGFQQEMDLKQVRLINDSLWRKLVPYIIIN